MFPTQCNTWWSICALFFLFLTENCDTFFPPLSSNHSDSSSPESGPGKNRKGRAPPVPNSNGETTVPVINDNTPSSRGGVGPREQRGSSTPKRTHSFSSFSQLSTNSLPDIKELHPTVLSIANHRHHYHGHGHGHMQGNLLQGVQTLGSNYQEFVWSHFSYHRAGS